MEILNPSRVIEYKRPYLYRLQENIFFNEARYVYCEASTKAGKTHGCIVWICEKALLEGFPGWNGWWVAPTTSQARIAMTRIKNAIPKHFYTVNEGEKYIQFINGARIWFKSAEKPDNLYGEDVFAVVLDEASRARHDSFKALRSTVTATRGSMRMIGNVKGKSNWFYLMCRKTQRKQTTAEDDGQIVNAKYFRLTAYDAVEAGVLELAEVEDAKAMLPSNDFGELYLAEAADDEDAFIGSAYVDEAGKRYDETEAFGPLVVGGDPSQGQGDPAAFAFRRGFKIMEVTEHPTMDEFGFIGECVRLVEEGYNGIRVARINVDATGFGATIVKALHKKGERYKTVIKGFHMQQRSLYPQEYGNKRAECWGELKKALTDQENLTAIPDDEGLAIEITCLRKKTDVAGRLLMEDKDDLKARGYDSPNKGDAVSYTYAEPVSFYSEEKINYPPAMKSRVIS